MKWSLTKQQWPLSPNSQKWRITRANVSNASLIFPDMTFGECGRVWRGRAKQLANVGKSGESEQNRLANVGESGEYSPSLMANVGAIGHDKIGRF
jgi:hypothetical protein